MEADKVKLNLKDRINGLVLNKEVISSLLEMNSLIGDSFGYKNTLERYQSNQ